MRENARSLEERITLYEELVTAAVFMAITRGLARCLQESCIMAKAVRIMTTKVVRSMAKAALAMVSSS